MMEKLAQRTVRMPERDLRIVGKFDHILPPYNRGHVEQFVLRTGDTYLQNFARKVEFYNTGRLAGITAETPCLFIPNHTAMKDYPISQYAIVRATQEPHSLKLPPTRIVAGANLQHPQFKRMFGVDFSDFGMYWFDRTESMRDFRETHHNAVKEVYSRGESLCVFAEGTRNRNPHEKLLEFKRGFIGAAQEAESELGLDIQFMGMAMHHERIPERAFYWLTDSGPKYGWKYFLGDRLANFWGQIMLNKGVTRINFGKPIKLRDISSGNNDAARAKSAAREAQNIVHNLYREIAR